MKTIPTILTSVALCAAANAAPPVFQRDINAEDAVVPGHISNGVKTIPVQIHIYGRNDYWEATKFGRDEWYFHRTEAQTLATMEAKAKSMFREVQFQKWFVMDAEEGFAAQVRDARSQEVQ
jgi:hypothetical protein